MKCFYSVLNLPLFCGVTVPVSHLLAVKNKHALVLYRSVWQIDFYLSQNPSMNWRTMIWMRSWLTWWQTSVRPRRSWQQKLNVCTSQGNYHLHRLHPTSQVWSSPHPHPICPHHRAAGVAPWPLQPHQPPRLYLHHPRRVSSPAKWVTVSQVGLLIYTHYNTTPHLSSSSHRSLWNSLEWLR